MSAQAREFISLTDVSEQANSAAAGSADACVPTTGGAPLSLIDAAAVAGVLKAVADPLRLRMLSYLVQADHTEACVCDLAELADVSQPTVSHHLKVLREAGLLTAERRGTWVWYSISPGSAASVDALLDGFAATLTNPEATVLGENA